MADDPTLSGGAPSGAPIAAPPSGGPSAGATPGPSPAPNGATPPLGGPAAQAAQPLGLIMKAQKDGALAINLLNGMLQAYNPGDEVWQAINSSLTKLAKHFPAAQSQMPQPKMNTGNAASAMPMPQMSGGPLGAMAPRGPIPGPQA